MLLSAVVLVLVLVQVKLAAGFAKSGPLWFPDVSCSAYRRLLQHTTLAGNEPLPRDRLGFAHLGTVY